MSSFRGSKEHGRINKEECAGRGNSLLNRDTGESKQPDLEVDILSSSFDNKLTLAPNSSRPSLNRETNDESIFPLELDQPPNADITYHKEYEQLGYHLITHEPTRSKLQKSLRRKPRLYPLRYQYEEDTPNFDFQLHAQSDISTFPLSFSPPTPVLHPRPIEPDIKDIPPLHDQLGPTAIQLQRNSSHIRADPTHRYMSKSKTSVIAVPKEPRSWVTPELRGATLVARFDS